MVWLDYADFILISVYMHPQPYAVHASVQYWFQYTDTEISTINLISVV